MYATPSYSEEPTTHTEEPPKAEDEIPFTATPSLEEPTTSEKMESIPTQESVPEPVSEGVTTEPIAPKTTESDERLEKKIAQFDDDEDDQVEVEEEIIIVHIEGTRPGEPD